MFRRLLPRMLPLGVAFYSACSVSVPPAPRTEFLLASPDSTFWVSSGADGVHVRGVPMVLTHYAGHFYEVYVADLDRSFTDAVFTGERLYVRDLATSDSIKVYEDTTVIRLSESYAWSNPHAQRLGPDDDTPDDPHMTATGETDILDVLGPYVLLEHRSSVATEAGERNDTVYAAVDLRTAHAVTTKMLMRDPMTHDTTAVILPPHLWRRAGYELLARNDSVAAAVSFLLRDSSHRSWPVVTIGGRARIYWLDRPLLDATTRRALLNAFNSAAMYNEQVKYVRRVAPQRRPLRIRLAHFSHAS